MELAQAVVKRRSVRLFKQDEIPDDVILDLVKMASCASSAGNFQPLRYIVIKSKKKLEEVFGAAAWAAQVRPHRNPEWGKTSPKAFIAVVAKRASDSENHSAAIDAGAAIQILQLAATDKGLGSCWIGAFNKFKINEILGLSGEFCLFLIALGVPAEAPVMERVSLGQSVKYYLDSDNVMHVPKYLPNEITRFV